MKRAPRLALVDPRGELVLALRVGLEDRGFEVVTLSEPGSALRGLVEAAPDLICIGVAAQHETGFRLYEELVGDPLLCRCPVVVLGESGSDREAFSNLAASAGVPTPAGVLAGPVDLDELIRTVNVLLGRPVGVAP